MGNTDFIHKKSLIRFHDGLSWLMQIIMFLTLGLLVLPTQLWKVIPIGLLIALFLMLVARPVSVFMTLLFSKTSLQENIFISWVGLRGAVPIIVAIFPLVYGIPKASIIFNIVFFIVLLSILVQGTTIPTVARWLKLDLPMVKQSYHPLEFMPAGKSKNDLIEVPVPEGSPIAGNSIVRLGLSKNVLIVLIIRDEQFVIPSGNTIIKAGDIMLVLAEKSELPAFCNLV
jgi:cell volume regulation protein A